MARPSALRTQDRQDVHSAFALDCCVPFQIALPSAPLRRNVQAIWSVEEPGAVERDRVLPNGVLELIINLGSNEHGVVDPEDAGRSQRFKRSWVAGLQEGPLIIDEATESHLVGVRFLPGGAHDLLGFPLREVTNLVMEGEALSLPWLEELRERLLEKPQWPARAALVQQYLERAMGPTPGRPAWLDVALNRLADQESPRRIRDISEELGLTHRQLIERFRSSVGVTPRRLARIFRLQQVLQCVAGRERVNWAQVASECGFADQAHLNHEFRDLAGVRPSEYLAQRYDEDGDHMMER